LTKFAVNLQMGSHHFIHILPIQSLSRSIVFSNTICSRN